MISPVCLRSVCFELPYPDDDEWLESVLLTGSAVSPKFDFFCSLVSALFPAGSCSR